jgi:two-component system, NarL family, nitrate/nitrite response regulator NarL
MGRIAAVVGAAAVVVDEMPLVRSGLAAITVAAGVRTVAAVRTAREAFEILGGDPDCLLVCGTAADREPAEIARRLRTLRPTPPAVLLLAPGDESVAAYAAAAGFLGVGLRTAEETEIAALVEAALGGERRVSPALHADLGALRPLADRAEPLLSAREREVLVLVAEGHDNRAIATRLAISPATVKSHLVRIYGKLGAADRREAVGRAVQLGILG